MGIALNYPHHRRHHHCCRRCYHLFDSIRAIHSKGLKEMVIEGGGDLLVVPGFAAIQIVWLVVVLMTDDSGVRQAGWWWGGSKRGVVPTTSRWWSKEGAWQGGGVDKGGAAAVYKMLIWLLNLCRRTHILRRTAPQSCPPKWVTKGPRQFTGHFAPPAQPACLLACTNCVFRKRQLGGRRVISQTYLCHLHIERLNVT